MQMPRPRRECRVRERFHNRTGICIADAEIRAQVLQPSIHWDNKTTSIDKCDCDHKNRKTAANYPCALGSKTKLAAMHESQAMRIVIPSSGLIDPSVCEISADQRINIFDPVIRSRMCLPTRSTFRVP